MTNKNLSSRYLSGSSLAAFITATTVTTVFAQEAGNVEGSISEYDTIIVTAQKRDQSITEVPIAITALGADQLQKTRARSIGDFQQLAPNFSFESVNGFDNINIRGVGGGGRNVGFDTRAGLFIDGVYIGQSAALSQPLFDIERVEVLRGPQGHLFGRNTVSGAVNLVTAPPSDEFGGSIRGVIGNEDAYEIYGTIEGPLSDRILGKISGAYETRGGFVGNTFDGEELDDLERGTVRGQLRFLASDRLTVDVFGDYSKTDQNLLVGEPQTDFFGVITPGVPAPSRVVNFNTSPFSNREIGGTSVTANYELDSGHSLTSVTGYRYASQDRRNDTDYGPNDLLFIDFADESNQISQEFRVTSPSDKRIRYVVGLYFLNEDAQTSRLATIGQDTTALVPVPVPGVFLPFGPAFGLTSGGVTRVDAEVETTNFAAFTAIDFDILDRVTLNLGGRYTNEKKELLFNLDGSQSGGLGIASLANFEDEFNEDRFTPTVGLTVQLSDNVNLYGKYATGFKSGGFNVDFLNAAQLTDFSFETETVDSYEIGLKGVLADGRVQFDIAGFTAGYDDFQILQFVDLGGGVTAIQLRNAAEVRSKGIEASGSIQLTERLRVGGNIGILDAEFTSFPDAVGPSVDFTGNELPNSPGLTGAVTVNYTKPLTALGGDLDFYFEYSHRSDSFSESANDRVLDFIEARDLVNSQITFVPNGGSWTVGLWSRNLFNEDFLDVRLRDFLGNELVRRGAPRTYGAEVSYKF